MLRWQALADGVLDATVARMMETRRPPEQQSARDIARQEEKVARSLDWIETQVGPGKYLMGSDFSLADLVVGVALDYVDFRYPHDWATRLPKLSRWHQAIRQRPSFVETAPATSLSRGPRLDPIGETRAPGMK
jgi:glutathione S-transferase